MWRPRGGTTHVAVPVETTRPEEDCRSTAAPRSQLVAGALVLRCPMNTSFSAVKLRRSSAVARTIVQLVTAGRPRHYDRDP